MDTRAAISDEHLADLQDQLDYIARKFGCTARLRLIPARGVSAHFIQIVVTRDRLTGPPLHHWKAVRLATYELRGSEVFESFIRDEAGPNLRDRADA
jgi:hypothetical protein